MRNPVGVSFLAALVFLAGCRGKEASYRSPAEVATAMTQMSRAHRFDRAVQIGQDWLHSHPQDAVIYHQIAMTFLLNANVDPLHKRELLNQSSDYFDKSFQVEPDNPFAALNAALGFESIANLSSGDDRCGFYERANAALKRQEPLLVGDQYVLRNGQVISVSPLRTEHDRLQSKLRDEMEKARCR
jgi:hypothetical protein